MNQNLKASQFAFNNSEYIWGSSIQQRKKQQDCRSVDFITLQNGEHITISGIYDGHGNSDLASMYCSEFFPIQVKNAVEYALNCYEQLPEKSQNHLDMLIATNIRGAFLMLDQNYGTLEGSTCTKSGSTCCVCVEFRKKLYFINVGDSRCIGGCLPFYTVSNENESNKKFTIIPKYNSTFEQFTIDHCASSNKYEIERVKKNGAILSGARMFPEKCLNWWSFMLTRSFGNTFAKGKCMIADPDVFIKSIDPIPNVYNSYPSNIEGDLNYVKTGDPYKVKYIEALIGRHQNILSTLQIVDISIKELYEKQDIITAQFEAAREGKVIITTAQKTKYIQKLETISKQLIGLEQTRTNLVTVFHKLSTDLKVENIEIGNYEKSKTTFKKKMTLDEIRNFKAFNVGSATDHQNIMFANSDLSNGGTDSTPLYRKSDSDNVETYDCTRECIITTNGEILSEINSIEQQQPSFKDQLKKISENNELFNNGLVSSKFKLPEREDNALSCATYYNQTQNSYYITSIGGESKLYDLDHGSCDNYKIPEVDYIVLASDGVWSPLKNIEVHEIVDNSYRRFFETGDIRYINPCNIAISIGIRAIQVVTNGNLHKDDITVIVGIKKSKLEKQCEALSIPMQINMQINLNYSEIIGSLDIWYENLKRLLTDYYKKLMQQPIKEHMFVKLMTFLQGSLELGLEDPSNQMRFFIKLDKLIKKHHEKYIDMKLYGSEIFQMRTYTY